MTVSIQNVSNTKVHVYVQYLDDVVRLLEGYSHSVQGKMVKPQPRKFYYPVFSPLDIEIFVDNKVGEYKVYATLLIYSEFEKKMVET